MKRLQFLAALIGLGSLTRLRAAKFKNGECPYCAEMSEPFGPSEPLEDSVINMLYHSASTDKKKSQSKIARCHNCNAAFFQDAEIPHND